MSAHKLVILDEDKYKVSDEVRMLDISVGHLKAIMREENDVVKALSCFPNVKPSYAAECLDVDPETIRNWRKSGKLKHDANGKISLVDLWRLMNTKD